LLIRKIESEDLNKCSALYSRVFSAPPWSEAWSQEKAYTRLNHFYQSAGFVGLLAESESVTGFVLGNMEPFLDGTWFYLREMCVDNSAQNQGVGTKLLNELNKGLISKAVKNIYLATERDIPAAKFYENNGYLKEDKMAFYYRRLN